MARSAMAMRLGLGEKAFPLGSFGNCHMTWRESHGAKRSSLVWRLIPWGVLGIAIWLSARAMARSALALFGGPACFWGYSEDRQDIIILFIVYPQSKWKRKQGRASKLTIPSAIMKQLSKPRVIRNCDEWLSMCLSCPKTCQQARDRRALPLCSL